VTGKKTNSAKNLKREWNIPAIQVRFHKGSTFFMPLNMNSNEFPAALIDPNGYIIFKTPESYLSCPKLKIGERINVHQGISSIQGYINKQRLDKARVNDLLPPYNIELLASDIQDADDPSIRETIVRRYIRDTAATRALKQLHENKCQICGLALPMGDGTYSEAHHIRPLGEPHLGPDIPSNILILCPNHHAQCDFGAITLEFEALRKINGHNINDIFINYHNRVIVFAKSS
jgi:hypothetical protein